MKLVDGISHVATVTDDLDRLAAFYQRVAEDNGAGATDARIIDFGALYSLHYADPDGVQLEINVFKDDWTTREALKREAWTTVDPEPTAS